MRPLARQQFCCTVPPIHHEVRAFVHMRVRGPQSLDIRGTKSSAHCRAFSNKRRIADNVIRCRPFGAPRVCIAVNLNLIAFRVGSLKRATVFVPRKHRRAPRQNRVRNLDRLKILQDRFRRNAAARAKMPLQKANPQNEFGNRRRPRIHLQPQKLMRIDGLQFISGETRLLGKARQRLQNLALKPFHQFERHVKKVSRPASGVENLGLAKPFVKRLYLGLRALGVAAGAFGLRRRLNIGPFGF